MRLEKFYVNPWFTSEERAAGNVGTGFISFDANDEVKNMMNAYREMLTYLKSAKTRTWWSSRNFECSP